MRFFLSLSPLLSTRPWVLYVDFLQSVCQIEDKIRCVT